MNVILIISDTVRYDYLGCYGSEWVRTPCIDKLASESAVFERFFTASFPTGPMRKDLHTGRFTFTYTNWQEPRGEGEVVLSEWLRQHGYTTAFIGDTGNSRQIAAQFDYEDVISGEASKLSEQPETVPLPADPRKLRIPMPRIQRIVRNAMGWDGEADRRAPRTMLAAHRWLEDHCNDEKPFFLWVDTFDPHEPWDPPRYYIDSYDPDYEGDELMEPAYEPAGYASAEEIEHMRKMYAAKLTMVDRWVGHLLDGVDQMGLRDDTAVIFTSDHGFYHGEHGLIGKVRLDREGKICGRWPLYDTIAHPPLLLRAPGVEAGRRVDAFCQPPDLTATILDLLDAPAHDRLQGVSLLPAARGKTDKVREFAISSLSYLMDEQVRCPTTFRTADALYVYGGDEWPQSEFYDLGEDPGETRNVFERRRDDAKRLHEQMLGFLEELDCPRRSLDLRREFNPEPRSDIPYVKVL